MKNINIYLVLLLIALSFSCTDKFEEYNTPKEVVTDQVKAIDNKNIGAFFPQMQKSIYFNFDNSNWKYQLQQNLYGDIYSGYFMHPSTYKNEQNTSTYVNVDWNNWAFNLGYDNIMAPWRKINIEANGNFEDFRGVSFLLKVAGMHRVTDMYGPIPYSKFGEVSQTVPYDSQKDVYKQFFNELDSAHLYLSRYVEKYPEATPFKEFDLIFDGNYKMWLKWVNSLRLRLAVRLSVAEPGLAIAEANKAVESKYGLLKDKNVEVKDKTYFHPLNTIANSWNDLRMGACAQSILVGLKDPRLPKYFKKAEYSGHTDEYIGIRYGVYQKSKDARLSYSKLGADFDLSNKENNPVLLMTSAEVYFLLAEAKLRGWNLAAEGFPTSVEELYKDGVKNSLAKWGVAGGYDTYINDDESIPSNFTDYVDESNNIDAVSTVTVKWDSGGDNESKLEKIITQKWIAMFPEGQEAWTEFRRTGYPKLFPMKVNNSGGTISSTTLIRRVNFTFDEYRDNEAEVLKAVKLLNPQVDNGGTRLWWDTGSNF
jgi:hypothetical protein